MKKTAAEPAAKFSAKRAAKPAVKPVHERAAPSPAKAKEAAGAKPRKAKLVRDSFTIPKDEYLAIEALKQRAAQSGRTVKKSELLRAGLVALAGMDASQFLSAIEAVPQIKTGRPKAA